MSGGVMDRKLENVIVSIDLNEIYIDDAIDLMHLVMDKIGQMKSFRMYGYTVVKYLLMNIVITKDKYNKIIKPIEETIEERELKGVKLVMLNAYQKPIVDEYMTSLAKADYIIEFGKKYDKREQQRIISMVIDKSEHYVHQYITIPNHSIVVECEWLRLRQGLPVETCELEKHRNVCESCKKNIRMITDEQMRTSYHG